MEIKGFLQTYAWGKLGSSSLVARLSGEPIDSNAPYAELWMGTHPSGMSLVKDNNIPLKNYIDGNPQILGRLVDYWENNENLPFLFKVLSVNKALSIQVHPDKDTAEMLHHNFPTIYRDPNYKPEMAIALTDFRALCGFRPTSVLKDVCANVPELQLLITPQLLSSYKKTMDAEVLRKIIFNMLSRSEEVVNEAVQGFLKRLENAEEDVKIKYCYDLIKKLNQEFPGDSGIFMALFLNDVHLLPGESLYIPAGLPHAYLLGDCIECMACSDNVVRAGLTPKYKDIETLLQILDYQSYTSDSVKLEPEIISPYTARYNPPIPDFGVSQVVVPEGESWLSPAHDSCQIFIVTDGEGSCLGERIKEPVSEGENENSSKQEESKNVGLAEDLRGKTEWPLKFGTIMFLPPYKQYKIASTKKLEMYFAYTNSQFTQPDTPLFVV